MTVANSILLTGSQATDLVERKLVYLRATLLRKFIGTTRLAFNDGLLSVLIKSH